MLTKDLSEQGLPDFDALASLFVRQGAFCSPAELHGSLCGHLAAGQRYAAAAWLQAAAQMMDVAALDEDTLVTELTALYPLSLGQLSGANFEFSLLLPDDEAPMPQRTEALGLWCHGFITGYAMAGGTMEGHLSADARETLQDLVQIAQVAADAEGNESDEVDFVEVCEYVRVSVLLVFSECNDTVAEPGVPAGEPLH